MDNGDDSPIERDWTWVFHQLTKGELSNRCSVPIPDTIVFQDSEPNRWVFTAKSGLVMNRVRSKLKMAKIKRRFLERHQIDEDEDGDLPVCVRRKGVPGNIKVDILSASELIELCNDTTGASRAGVVSLQDYVEADKPINLKCVYTRTDKQVKGFKVETFKLNEITAETQGILNQGTIKQQMKEVKSQMIDANQEVEDLTFRIVRFVESRLSLVVLSMVAEYVLDDDNKPTFTHASKLITGPKPPRWKAPSGNNTRLEPNREVRPHLVRKKPLKDGTPVCCGDYCYSKIEEILNPPDETGGSDRPEISSFTNESKIEQIEKDSKQPIDRSKPVIGVRSILQKSIFLGRMEKGGTKIGDDTSLRKQLERRMLPQIKPTAQSKHSLHDYYDMVPVCEKCYKVYCHFDQERLKSHIIVDEAVEDEGILTASPLFGGGSPVAQDVGHDMSAKGIRQRLTELYTAQAKPMCSLFQPKVERAGSKLEEEAPNPRLAKRGSVVEEDYRLPDLAAQRGRAFPRSKTVQGFNATSSLDAPAKRGVQWADQDNSNL